MKKIYSFIFAISMAAPTFAQEVDATSYIQNAGFDEDLSWLADGSTKEIIDQSVRVSDRTQAWMSADGSIYARANVANRGDGLDFAWNGFFTQIQGWEAWSNKDANEIEWVYFGSVAYGMGETAIPIADNGNTCLQTPAKPFGFDTEDNKGVLYLRAGWGAAATYSQKVSLPEGKYRIEYMMYNDNYSGSANNTYVKNLCEVVSDDEHFNDTEGFAATDWTKHSVEFTTKGEVSIKFGFESSGGSGSNPILFIDCIKLYKIDGADGISEVISNTTDNSTIYQLTGAKTSALSKGLNIVVKGDKATKVLVK